MISTNEFRTGTTVTIDNDAWQVIEFQHVKPGKGAAFVRAKMRNLRTGSVVERNGQCDQLPERKHGHHDHVLQRHHSRCRAAEHS